MNMTNRLQLELPKEALKEFCHKWKIEELAVFGSVLRRDFRADSDIDVLATFSRDADWSVFDRSRLNDELSNLVGRPVDVVEQVGLRNPFRRREILANRRIIYAA
jgi:predicted nucleotidyltransferase